MQVLIDFFTEISVLKAKPLTHLEQTPFIWTNKLNIQFANKTKLRIAKLPRPDKCFVSRAREARSNQANVPGCRYNERNLAFIY